jgi:hypothetical protein
VRTRWLLRIVLAGAIGGTLPPHAPAQDAPPVPLPAPVANAAAANPAVVVHTHVPDPPPSLNLSPPPGIGPTAPPGSTPAPAVEFFPEAPRASGRFHILPQSFRDRIARRFGRGVSEAPAQPAELPEPAPRVIQVNPGLIPASATGEPTPVVPQEGIAMPTEFVPDAPPTSGRFHMLPQSWRDAVSRRLGRDTSVPEGNLTEMPAPGTTAEPPLAQGAVPAAGAVVSASAQPQTVPLGPPETLAPPVVANPPVDGFGLLPFRAPETWASPAEPPITSQAPLPLREPWMGWTKQPLSKPLPLPPPPAPSTTSHFHILPEGVRKTLGHCLNGYGMACYADRDTPGCGSLRQEFLFVFGSCRYFFS